VREEITEKGSPDNMQRRYLGKEGKTYSQNVRGGEKKVKAEGWEGLLIRYLPGENSWKTDRGKVLGG